jgi:hypothetical protein
MPTVLPIVLFSSIFCCDVQEYITIELFERIKIPWYSPYSYILRIMFGISWRTPSILELYNEYKDGENKKQSIKRMKKVLIPF